MQELITTILILLALAISALAYFAPSIIAFRRNHYYKWIILAINVCTGISGIGYLVAMVWALWPSKTGLADPFFNDPTSNSHASNQTIFNRYGLNLKAFRGAQAEGTVFIYTQNQQSGPFTVQDVRSMLLSGRVSLSDLAWYEGAPDWVSISSLPEIAKSLPPPMPPMRS